MLDLHNNSVNCDELYNEFPHVRIICDENPVRNQITTDVSTTIQKNIRTTQDPTLTSDIIEVVTNNSGNSTDTSTPLSRNRVLEELKDS